MAHSANPVVATGHHLPGPAEEWQRPGRSNRAPVAQAACRTNTTVRCRAMPGAKTALLHLLWMAAAVESALLCCGAGGIANITTSSPSCRHSSANIHARCSALPRPYSKHLPWPVRHRDFVGFELHVPHCPVEQRGRAIDVVETLAARPAGDVAEPNGLLQQPAFMRLEGRSTQCLARQMGRELRVGQ